MSAAFSSDYRKDISSMQASQRTSLLRAAGLLAVVFGAAAVAYVVQWRGSKIPVQEPERVAPVFPVPEISSSPFANTTDKARYVGSRTCLECHQEQHESYLQTAHSRALAEIRPEDEPPDAELLHEKSGRFYQVRRDEGRLWHRESLPISEEADAETVTVEHPLRYVIGSGHHSKSYLVEDDGFLVESPLTWFASTKNWQMSPGFDLDNRSHPSFERATTVACINCHSGRVEVVDNSFHRFNIPETSIGCEKCHGPGSLHVEARQNLLSDLGEPDDTIVNPKHLSRELQDDLCAQCHLRSAAVVLHRGRDESDYRPGLPLKDFRIDYQLQGADEAMTVTGHTEQMRLSKCWQNSTTLTCITCHPPHNKPAADNKQAHFRQTCLTCHQPEHCELDPAARLQKNPADNCVACHMPQVPTDITHFAFTHHRIGIHKQIKAPPENMPFGKLVPVQDLSHLSGADQIRSLGLAYMELADTDPNLQYAQAYRQQAWRLLNQVLRQGLDDADVYAALAQIHQMQESPQALSFAERALEFDEISARARGIAHFVAGVANLRQGNFEVAAEHLEQLVRLRRLSGDWLLLGLCRREQGDLKNAAQALERAQSINPFRGEIHLHLADLYAELGRAREAKKHRQIAGSLTGED